MDAWRPPLADRWAGSPGSGGPIPAATCVTPMVPADAAPACRRCTARRGITGPAACHLPPHQTVCRRHRLWTGPAARTHAAQLDLRGLPEIIRVQRRHATQLRHNQWWNIDTAISGATHAIYHALCAGIWISGQQQRPRPAPGNRPWPACPVGRRARLAASVSAWTVREQPA